ncbi:MAG: hypothetical protein JSW40_01975 [Candidatus Omnitrophota bacterium]|nr:MAG: hypothetical protein JSW40_01975 [Candidatus Omnitrophota bacterium]
MFDFSKLGDISKMANQAKEIHQEQERFQKQQIVLLTKITSQLEELLALLKEKTR